MRALLTALLVFLVPATWIGGALIHLYTIYIAYSVSGVFAALLSLVFPVLSQAYWFFAAWNITGDFINEYSVFLLSYLLLFLITVAVFAARPER